MSVVADSVNHAGQTSSIQFQVPEPTLPNDLGALLADQSFSDVTLHCHDGEEGELLRDVRAHKAILTARSDVFSAMFGHEGMSETEEHEVSITDVDPDVVEVRSLFCSIRRRLKKTLSLKVAPAQGGGGGAGRTPLENSGRGNHKGSP